MTAEARDALYERLNALLTAFVNQLCEFAAAVALAVALFLLDT